MSSRSDILNVFWACALIGAAGFPTPHSKLARAADDEGASSGPCTATKFHFPTIKQACKEGGRKKLRETIMKPAVQKAKEKGIKINDATVVCKSCHIDLKGYKLTKNAVEDLKRLL